MPTLLRKLENSKQGCKNTGTVYQSLTEKLSPHFVDEWKEEESKAMALGGEALDIYQPRYVQSE